MSFQTTLYSGPISVA